jgi:hypothetical protein
MAIKGDIQIELYIFKERLPYRKLIIQTPNNVENSPYGLRIDEIKIFKEMMGKLPKVLEMMNEGKVKNMMNLASISGYSSGTYMMSTSIRADVTTEQIHIYNYYRTDYNTGDELDVPCKLVTEYFPLSKYQLKKLVRSGKRFDDVYQSITNDIE